MRRPSRSLARHLPSTPSYLLEPLETRALLSTVPVIIHPSGTPTLVAQGSGDNSVPSIIDPTGHPTLVLTSGAAPALAGAVTTSIHLTAAVENGFTVAILAVVQSFDAGELPSGTVTFRTTGGTFLANLNVSSLKTSFANPALGQVAVGLPLALMPSGTQTVVATYNGDILHAASTSNAVTITAVARRLIAIGGAPGTSAGITIVDTATGRTLRTFNPFPGFTGGIHVAVGDINGDGIPDVVTAPAAGGQPLVKVFDLATGDLIREFFAYDIAFRGGVNLAIGDVNGDGVQDIITAAGPGGGPHVEVFSGANGLKIESFFAFASNFTGGVSVASGDVTGDGDADIICAPMSQGGPEVAVFNGPTDTLLRTFFGFTRGFTGGLNVAVAGNDVDGAGGEIITSPRSGTVAQISIFPSNGVTATTTFNVANGVFGGGINLSTFDFDGDGVPDIIVSSANGNFRPEVFSGATHHEIGFLIPSGFVFSNSSFIAGFGD